MLNSIYEDEAPETGGPTVEDFYVDARGDGHITYSDGSSEVVRGYMEAVDHIDQNDLAPAIESMFPW